jgi:hypothetical protein
VLYGVRYYYVKCNVSHCIRYASKFKTQVKSSNFESLNELFIHKYFIVLIYSLCVGLDRMVAGISLSNSARGMDVCLLCLCVELSCVGRGLCDEMIYRPQESYRVSNKIQIYIYTHIHTLLTVLVLM